MEEQSQSPQGAGWENDKKKREKKGKRFMQCCRQKYNRNISKIQIKIKQDRIRR